ncbi:MAG: 4-hydroxy-tetrahydrodipicolinate reductase [bacterium]
MSTSNSQPIVVSGAAGRMGQTLLKLISQDDDLELVGALEHSESPEVGRNTSDLVDGAPDVTISDQPEDLLESGQTVIDFTRPAATRELLTLARERGTKLVIGTTGFSDGDLELIQDTGDETPIVKAPNMSVGINLLAGLVNQAVEVLGEDFDAEVLEMHHRHKEDAPSGTANMLAETIAEARDQDLESVREDGRRGFVGERASDEIGIAALRGGDVVGDHTVMLAGEGERIELTHRASSRETFGRGALRAAKFLNEKDSGLYTMKHVLNL